MAEATDAAAEHAPKNTSAVFLEIEVPDELHKTKSHLVAVDLPRPLRILCDEVTNLEAMAPTSVDQRSGTLLWEAAIDLGRFISRMPSPALSGARVLELGAGHGVPGLCCAILWGATVHFHDMSEETLRRVTAVNCAMNSVRSQFLAGDWSTLMAKESSESSKFSAGHCKRMKVQEADLSYNVILASEAFYKEESYDELLSFLSSQSHECHAYFAGKRFYFGCGGGTASFSSTARSRGFNVTVKEVIEDGLSNIREILHITWPEERHSKRPKTAS